MNKNILYIFLWLLCWGRQDLAVQAKSNGTVKGKTAVKSIKNSSKKANAACQSIDYTSIVASDATHKKVLSKENVYVDLKQSDQAIHVLQKQKEKLCSEVKSSHITLDTKLEEINQQIDKFEKILYMEKIQTQLIREQNNRLQAEMELIITQAQRDKYTHQQPVYLKNPLRKKDNILVLSDRCIDLNGEITPWKADFIVDKIAFFNRKNSYYPIFILIGYSPGGAVTAGIRILQAIKCSKAPVYIVVKDCAVSMAAILVALAPYSYACPGAVIMHHQPSILCLGNMNISKFEQNYRLLSKEEHYLCGAVAKKMGISLKTFNKNLFERGGEWKELSEDARKLKWVNHVINGIEDTAIYTLPVEDKYTIDKYFKVGALQTDSLNPLNQGVLKQGVSAIDEQYTLKNPKALINSTEKK